MSESPFKAIAQRIINAENAFIGMIMEVYAKSEDDAIAVFEVFKKERILKLDPINGTYRVKHGVFLEVSVIDRAIAQYCDSE